eukprot:TRINITY_DN1155_c0_g1_i2.p2 TRINITY_DN1155_c0_g1~~TRINITY_DN1155_c0_g1_i2.p2  ORF type:complete len:155 (-),score=30.25 TRINITY_DN1155_c0_g1_i2:81-545(-)
MSTRIAKCLFFPDTNSADGDNFMLLLGYIKSAKKSIDACVYCITDNRIARALIELHKKGVEVRVISDNDKAKDEGSDLVELKNAGIKVKTDQSAYHMHHKFCIVDGSLLINGSFNWTKGACFYNRENVMITNEPEFVKSFQDEFETLWTAFPFF